MELTSTLLILATVPYLVETVSPVDTHQTDHREEDMDTDTGRTFQILGIIPGVTCLYEGQTKNSGIAQEEWITELQ